MKNGFAHIAFLMLLFIGSASGAIAQLSIQATGTGNTTGPIGKLDISNTSGEPQRFNMPEYFYIPSANGHQGYLVANDASAGLVIRPGERAQLPLNNGFCTDIHRPPVPDGQPLPPFNTWITPDHAAPLPQPGAELPSGRGWVPANDGQQDLLPAYPGSGVPVPGRIDPDEHPAVAAPVLFEALRRISTTVDELYATGEVPPTPFSGQPAKERETLIQQTFWIYSSLLNPSDEDYTIADFAAQTWRQYSELQGDTSSIAPEVRKEVEEGIQSFWNSFEAVGVKAKVLVKSGLTDVSTPPSVECSCTFSSFNGIVITRDGERVDPGTTLQPGLYRFEASFTTDCPEGCASVINGSWAIDYIPENGGAVLQDFGQGATISFDVPGNGSLSVSFSGGVSCNGTPCPSANNGRHEARVTLPAERCPCESCELLQPMRILNARTGEPITGNTVPTYIDRIRLEPPEVRSDCPESCSGTNYVIVEREIRYRDGRTYQGHTSVPVEFGISGSGELILNGQYTCHCDGKPCGQGELTRTIRFAESNNCCDLIRRRNNGQLQFGFDNGTVAIERNRLTINVPPSPPETFRLSFNLEAIFCNLNDDQIYAVLERISSQSVTDAGVEEAVSVSDISLGGPVDAGGGRPHYSLLFSKRVNGREVVVNIILDEEACVFDIQVLYNGRLYEHAGPPYLTPAQLQQMALNMGYGTDPNFWYRALVLISHLARVRQYGRQQPYSRAMEAFLNSLHTGTSRLLQDVTDQALRARVEALLLAIVNAKIHGGWNQLDELLDKMIPVVERM